MDNIINSLDNLTPKAKEFACEFSELALSLTEKYSHIEGLIGLLFLAAALARKCSIPNSFFLVFCDHVWRKTDSPFIKQRGLQ